MWVWALGVKFDAGGGVGVGARAVWAKGMYMQSQDTDSVTVMCGPVQSPTRWFQYAGGVFQSLIHTVPARVVSVSNTCGFRTEREASSRPLQ
jgi:hypothetical protein